MEDWILWEEKRPPLNERFLDLMIKPFRYKDFTKSEKKEYLSILTQEILMEAKKSIIKDNRGKEIHKIYYVPVLDAVPLNSQWSKREIEKNDNVENIIEEVMGKPKWRYVPKENEG